MTSPEPDVGESSSLKSSCRLRCELSPLEGQRDFLYSLEPASRDPSEPIRVRHA